MHSLLISNRPADRGFYALTCGLFSFKYNQISCATTIFRYKSPETRKKFFFLSNL